VGGRSRWLFARGQLGGIRPEWGLPRRAGGHRLPRRFVFAAKPPPRSEPASASKTLSIDLKAPPAHRQLPAFLSIRLFPAAPRAAGTRARVCYQRLCTTTLGQRLSGEIHLSI